MVSTISVLPVPMASLAHNVHFVLVRRSYLGRVLRIKDSGQHAPLDALGGGSAFGSAASSCCAEAGAGGGWHCLARWVLSCNEGCKVGCKGFEGGLVFDFVYECVLSEPPAHSRTVGGRRAMI